MLMKVLVGEVVPIMVLGADMVLGGAALPALH
jgi:hypothetical protein